VVVAQTGGVADLFELGIALALGGSDVGGVQALSDDLTIHLGPQVNIPARVPHEVLADLLPLNHSRTDAPAGLVESRKLLAGVVIGGGHFLLAWFPNSLILLAPAVGIEPTT
jgi:hypothetical protein